MSLFHEAFPHLSKAWQPQQEADDSDDQDQDLPAATLPQLTWEHVCEACGQALHTHKL